MSNKLLGEGNTVASIDELYLFLSNLTAIEYIRLSLIHIWTNAGGVPNTCKSNGACYPEFFGRTENKASGGRVSNA